MMSAKLATVGLLKIKAFCNKGYDVITFVCDVTNKNLPRDSNYIVDAVKWPKFGNSSISMREVAPWSWIRLKLHVAIEKFDVACLSATYLDLCNLTDDEMLIFEAIA